MTTELVPSIPGRPGTVVQDGWTVYVGIKDADYILTKRRFKRTMFDVHPDRNGGKGGAQFRSARGRYRKWCDARRREYWAIGLMPPDWRGSPVAPPASPMRQIGGRLIPMIGPHQMEVCE